MPASHTLALKCLTRAASNLSPQVIESRAFKESPSKLTIALGKTIDGLNYVSDLTKMPHLLIAGTTGSGKSVGVNSLLVSIRIAPARRS